MSLEFVCLKPKKPSHIANPPKLVETALYRLVRNASAGVGVEFMDLVEIFSDSNEPDSM